MSPKALRVLLVEDNPDDAELFQEMLARETGLAYIIVHRERLRQALEAMGAQAFDVVLLDLSLPDSEGLGTVRMLREAAPVDVPVVVLTGMDDEEIALQALQEGVQDYLVKSRAIDEHVLDRAIRHATERQRVLAERDHNHRLLLALSEGAQAVQRARTEEEVYHNVGKAVQALGYRVTIMTRCADEECLEVAYQDLQSVPPPDAPDLGAIPMERIRIRFTSDSQVMSILQGGQTRVFTSMADALDETLPDDLHELGRQLLHTLDLRECIVARLAIGAEPYGLLAVCGRDLTEADIPAVTAFANQTAIALENVRHMELARASEARFRAIYEDAALGVGVWDLTGRLVDSNAALAALIHTPAHANGDAPTLAGIFPPQENKEQRVEAGFACLTQGQTDAYRAEVRFLSSAGTVRWGSLVLSLVRDARQRPLFIIGMLDDISERKEVQAALLRAEQLAVTGKLAAALAHEINNPLQAVIGCLGLADESLAGSDEVQRYLAVARKELHRTARIVGRLRDLQIQSSEDTREPTDVNAVLDSLIGLLSSRLVEAGIQLSWQPSPDVPVISAAKDRLQQVFLNLVLNAIDAMPQGGRMWVRTAVTPDPAGIRVEIGDTGTGIHPEVMPHIFDFLYSTKAQGTGLGLFLSQNIIREHGGNISTSSTVGEGTIFSVWLPIQSTAP
ncbi:MAG: ATP-binding protein [Anaerolineae bacterium]